MYDIFKQHTYASSVAYRNFNLLIKIKLTIKWSLRYQCTPNDHHSSASRYGQTFDANPSKVNIF